MVNLMYTNLEIYYILACFIVPNNIFKKYRTTI